jgi:hypothetical protein
MTDPELSSVVFEIQLKRVGGNYGLDPVQPLTPWEARILMKSAPPIEPLNLQLPPLQSASKPVPIDMPPLPPNSQADAPNTDSFLVPITLASDILA